MTDDVNSNGFICNFQIETTTSQRHINVNMQILPSSFSTYLNLYTHVSYYLSQTPHIMSILKLYHKIVDQQTSKTKITIGIYVLCLIVALRENSWRIWVTFCILFVIVGPLWHFHCFKRKMCRTDAAKNVLMRVKAKN